MNGSIRARVVAPPRPGSSPTQKPSTIPSAMKASAFHCSTSTSPSSRASSIAYSPNLNLRRSLAELYILAEFVDHVLGLGQHLFHHLHGHVRADVVEVHFRLGGLGDELLVVDCLGERLAHDLQVLGGG